MLAWAVLGTLAGAMTFGATPEGNGRLCIWIRLTAATFTGVAALAASGLLFDHPGWDMAFLEGKRYGSGGAALFAGALLAGPNVLGWVFLTVAVLALAMARFMWLEIQGREPNPAGSVLDYAADLVLSLLAPMA